MRPRKLLIKRLIVSTLAIAAFVAALVWYVSDSPRTIRVGDGLVFALEFSPDGTRLSTTGKDYMKLWELPSGRRLQAAIKCPGGFIRWTEFAEDGKTISACWAFGDGTDWVTTWDARFGVQMSQTFAPAVNGVPASSGTEVSAHLVGKAVVVYVSRQEQLTLEGQSEPVNCVTLSTDGKLLATGSGDLARGGLTWKNGDLRLWDAQTGRLLASRSGHRRPITAVCFSPDGKSLASAGLDGTLQIWDVGRLAGR